MDIKQSHFINILLLNFFILALLLTASHSSATENLPHEFTADYVLEKFSITLARATYTLAHTEDGIRMTQSTRPAGLVALLRNDKIDIVSDMVFDNGHILLVKYDYRHTGDEKDRNVYFTIDWNAADKDPLTGNVKGSYQGEPVDLSVNLPVWDPLSIQVPLMIDAGKNKSPHEHGMFLKGEFKYYIFENLGNETISLNDREYRAVKMVGEETKRDRAMYAWLVPDLHYIPVKIEQWKNGKLNSTVLLQNVKFKDGLEAAITENDDLL